MSTLENLKQLLLNVVGRGETKEGPKLTAKDLENLNDNELRLLKQLITDENFGKEGLPPTAAGMVAPNELEATAAGEDNNQEAANDSNEPQTEPAQQQSNEEEITSVEDLPQEAAAAGEGAPDSGGIAEELLILWGQRGIDQDLPRQWLNQISSLEQDFRERDILDEEPIAREDCYTVQESAIHGYGSGKDEDGSAHVEGNVLDNDFLPDNAKITKVFYDYNGDGQISEFEREEYAYEPNPENGIVKIHGHYGFLKLYTQDYDGHAAGSFEFWLKHPSENVPDMIEAEMFFYELTDDDGQTDLGKLKFEIEDDMPIARDDYATIYESSLLDWRDDRDRDGGRDRRRGNDDNKHHNDDDCESMVYDPRYFQDNWHGEMPEDYYYGWHRQDYHDNYDERGYDYYYGHDYNYSYGHNPKLHPKEIWGKLLENDELGADHHINDGTKIINVEFYHHDEEGEGSETMESFFSQYGEYEHHYYGDYIVIENEFEKLSVNKYTGKYHYTLKQNTTEGVDDIRVFHYTLEDGDGSTSTASLTIRIVDDAPEACDDMNWVFESALPWGSDSHQMDNNNFNGRRGDNNHDNDNNEYKSTMAFGNLLENDKLSADGVWLHSVNGKEAEDGVIKIYTDAGILLVFTTDYAAQHYGLFKAGDYKYTLKHSTEKGVNDMEQFTYVIKDGDGDYSQATLKIQIHDDGPKAKDDYNMVDEAGLPWGTSHNHGSNMATGNLFSNDKSGADHGLMVKSLKFYNKNYYPDHYNQIEINVHGVGKLVVNAMTGEYKFTLLDNVNHKYFDSLHFEYTVKDSDGSTDSAKLWIDIKDDGPVAHDDRNMVDESALRWGSGKNDGSTMATGNLLANDKSGADHGLMIKSLKFYNKNYYPDHYNQIEINVHGVGKLVVNAMTGEYKFTLLDNVNHKYFDSLHFEYTVKDSDGSTDSAKLWIDIKDDGPVAHDDRNMVDESALRWGTDQNHGSTMATGNLIANDKSGADHGLMIKSLSYHYKQYYPDHYNQIKINVDGIGKLVVNAMTGEYKFTLEHAVNHNEIDKLHFEYTVKDSDGSTDDANLWIAIKDDGPVAHDDRNMVDESALRWGTDQNHGSTMATGNLIANDKSGADHGLMIKSLSYHYKQYYPDHYNQIKINVDGIGKLVVNAMTGEYKFTLEHAVNHNEIDSLHFEYTVKDSDGSTDDANLWIAIKDDGPVAHDDRNMVDESALRWGSGQNDGSTMATGNLIANDKSGADHGLMIKSLSYHYKQYYPDHYNQIKINVDGIGKLVVNAMTGEYKFTLEHAVNHNEIDSLHFEYTVKDSDGSTDSAKLWIDIKDDGPVAHDDRNMVDESALEHYGTGKNEGSTMALGNLIANDKSGADHGLMIKSVSYHYQTYQPDHYGQIVINAAGIGKLVVNAMTGEYKFTLTNSVDHDEIDSVHFEYTVKDSDGSTDSANLWIAIKDDGPIAHDDRNMVDESALEHYGTGMNNGSSMARGNLFANDKSGADHDLMVKSVSYHYQNYEPDHYGQIIIDTGDYGQLVIDAMTGNYKYTLTSNVDHDEIDSVHFKYVVKDVDGSESEAKLWIDIKDDAPKTLVEHGQLEISEADIKNIGSNMNMEQPAMVMADAFRLFERGADHATIKSVMYNGDTYYEHYGQIHFDVFVAGNGKIGEFWADTETGKVKFTLFKAIDNHYNDLTSLGFKITVQDIDGDKADANLWVKVIDDMPVLQDDHNTLVISHHNDNDNYSRHGHNSYDSQKVFGNILENDKLGADGFGGICSVNGEEDHYGVIKVFGEYGKLTVYTTLESALANGKDKAGDYKYELYDNMQSQHNYQSLHDIYEQHHAEQEMQPNYIHREDGYYMQINEKFEYAVKDGDGDLKTADLNIWIEKPVFHLNNDENWVSEADLPDIGSNMSQMGAMATGNIFDNDEYYNSDNLKILAVDYNTSHYGVIKFETEHGWFELYTSDYVAHHNGFDKAGDYKYTLKEALMHDVEDAVEHFKIIVKDNYGQYTIQTLDIAIHDDAPMAMKDWIEVGTLGEIEVPDSSCLTLEQIQEIYSSSSSSASGNVLANDKPGADNDIRVTKITFNAGSVMQAMEYAGPNAMINGAIVMLMIPEMGKLSFDTALGGHFEISQDGDYQYTAPDDAAGETEIFGYTIVDKDGSESNARLDIDISSESGPSVITGDRGDDVLNGSEGDDIIFTGNGKNEAYGHGGNDILVGGNGKDMLYGGEGDDHISGCNGMDTELNGGAGSDTLEGGLGPDTFVFNLHEMNPTDMDVIKDLGNTDTLRFNDVVDNGDVPGLDITDVFASISDVGADSVEATLHNGAKITFEGIGHVGSTDVQDLETHLNSIGVNVDYNA